MKCFLKYIGFIALWQLLTIANSIYGQGYRSISSINAEYEITPTVILGTMGQSNLLKRYQLEGGYGFGFNGMSSSSKVTDFYVHYCRLRYGIRNNLNLSIDGTSSGLYYAGYKASIQYSPFKYLVLDMTIGRGLTYAEPINYGGIGATLDFRLNKSKTFGIYSSVRTVTTLNYYENEQLDPSQSLLCLGLSGFVNKKNSLLLFSEIGLTKHRLRQSPYRLSNGYYDYYFGLGLSYRLSLKKQ